MKCKLCLLLLAISTSPGCAMMQDFLLDVFVNSAVEAAWPDHEDQKPLPMDRDFRG